MEEESRFMKIPPVAMVVVVVEEEAAAAAEIARGANQDRVQDQFLVQGREADQSRDQYQSQDPSRGQLLNQDLGVSLGLHPSRGLDQGADLDPQRVQRLQDIRLDLDLVLVLEQVNIQKNVILHHQNQMDKTHPNYKTYSGYY